VLSATKQRTRRRRPNAPLGGTQRHVLLVLGTRGASAANDWAAWYPLEAAQVRSAINRLGMRGLVDVAGWNGRARTYKLTEDGVEAVNKIAPSDDADDA
jgi:predicted ArsR family transcriptional regulator